MIWGAFIGYGKCPIVVMASNKRTSANFVDIVYEGRLSGFFYMHDDPQSLFLMEDGATLHRSNLPKQWREAHKIRKIIWPANSPDAESHRECLDDSKRLCTKGDQAKQQRQIDR